MKMAGDLPTCTALQPANGSNSEGPSAVHASARESGTPSKRRHVLAVPASVISWVLSQIFNGLGLGRVLSLGRTVPPLPPTEEDAPKTPTLKGEKSNAWDESSDTTQECVDWSTPSGLSIGIEFEAVRGIRKDVDDDEGVPGIDEEEEEPVLREEGNHFCMFPLRFPQIWDVYKTALGNFWTVEDVDLSRDTSDWRLLSGAERTFVKTALAILGGSDAAVLENLALRFMTDVMAPEARAFYGFQIAMENVHTELYSKLQHHYIEDASERAKLVLAIQTAPSAKKKADWGLKLINSVDSFAHRLVAFACIQSLHFTRTFFTLWLKSRDLMPALTGSSELISRDRSLHAHFTCLLYNLLDNRLSDCTAHQIVQEAVQLEKEFCFEVLDVGTAGLDAEKVIEYVEFAADRLLVDLGHQNLYLTHSPFNNMVDHRTEVNGIEKNESKQTGVTSSLGYSWSNYVLTYDADF